MLSSSFQRYSCRIYVSLEQCNCSGVQSLITGHQIQLFPYFQLSSIQDPSTCKSIAAPNKLNRSSLNACINVKDSKFLLKSSFFYKFRFAVSVYRISIYGLFMVFLTDELEFAIEQAQMGDTWMAIWSCGKWINWLSPVYRDGKL